MILFRRVMNGISRPTGLWLMLLVLLVAAAPSVCMIWFMNQAVRNERLAVQQRLAESYRGHLAAAREKLDQSCDRVLRELDTGNDHESPACRFARLVASGNVDAVICFDANGSVAYPQAFTSTPGMPARADEWTRAEQLEAADPAGAARLFAAIATGATQANVAAQALQAQARCLERAGEREPAIEVLTRLGTEDQWQTARDGQGRFIAPNALLRAIELHGVSEKSQALRERLRAIVSNYENGMLSAQRRFLMRELGELSPGQPPFPTMAAEELAARFVEAGPLRLGEPKWEPGKLQGTWQITSPGKTTIALSESGKLVERCQSRLRSPALPENVELLVLPPGKAAEPGWLTVDAGGALPGWRIGLAGSQQALLDSTAHQRITAYVWIGVLVVGAVLVLGALALGMVRRQVALTRLRNDLVANVTHELKTPLASMRLLVDTLLEPGRKHDQATREYLELIATENNRLSRLIDNFLAFSRMERNKRAFEFKLVPALSLAQGAVQAMGERLKGPGCRFELRASEDLPVVSADPDAMITALVNLLDNACKYSGDEKRVTLRAEARNGRVLFAVEDNGIGLSARERQRIFQRFYQVDQRVSKAVGGCGLGLSIVRFIVSAHEGEVEVESEPGRGSTFTISLPTAAKPGFGNKA